MKIKYNNPGKTPRQNNRIVTTKLPRDFLASFPRYPQFGFEQIASSFAKRTPSLTTTSSRPSSPGFAFLNTA
jgi:hypothetical protein